MSDNSTELKSQVRDAERKVRTSATELKVARSGRIKLASWSAIGGFMLFAIGGHWFPGYQLDSTAEATANEKAAGAVRDVVAQICAERFMRASGLESRLAALEAESGNWSRATYLRDGTWATGPDGERADHATAEKCRSLIADRVAAKSGEASG